MAAVSFGARAPVAGCSAVVGGRIRGALLGVGGGAVKEGPLLPATLVRLAVSSSVPVRVLAAVRWGGGLLLPAALVRLAVATAVLVSVLAPVRLGWGDAVRRRCCSGCFCLGGAAV